MAPPPASSASSAAALKARGFAGILSSESAGVMAVMRQNSKWALVPGYGYGDDDAPDDPLLELFKSMRRRLFTWRDWDQVAPLGVPCPFPSGDSLRRDERSDYRVRPRASPPRSIALSASPRGPRARSRI